jgi:aminoglycoside phosphotransferase (APT) family kinase protein
MPERWRTVVSDQVTHDLPPGWDEGFDRMARALGSNEPPSDLNRLTGGLEGATFAFGLREDRLVVKIYVEDGDLARTEFDNLTVVSAAKVPTPEPVLMDGDGEWFQAPAIVMTALPGRPDMHLRDRKLWVDGAAEALASVHDIPATRAGRVRPPRWQRWRPSTEGMGSDSSRADAMLARLYDQTETSATVLSHDDYNPGNLLFDGGRLSGVVDWAYITIEPRHAAVALFRHFLAIHPVGKTPEMFLDAYEHAAKTSLDDLPLWDVLYGLRGVRPVDHWVLAFNGLGLDITSTEIQDRSRAWVRKAIVNAED